MNQIGDLIPVIKATMAKYNVRAFGEQVLTDPFGVKTVSINGHINDLRFCDSAGMFLALQLACNAEVTYAASNNAILVRPSPEHRPGTVSYRFSRLLEELDKRFPKGADHRRFCAEPPELHLLREIDAYLAQTIPPDAS
jgi:hypothetical protein